MARVAPFVGVITWKRPEPVPFLPKEIVVEVVDRRLGGRRTPFREAVEEMSLAVGSEAALAELMPSAGLEPTPRR